jgi:uncharacterized protein YodC (DUF2158 family)
MSFKVGDIVKLKSGGPDMTVTKIGAAGEEPMAWCVWFEGTKDSYGLFPPEALVASSEFATARKVSEPEQELKPPSQQPEALKEPQLGEADDAPPTPEPVEASQEPHPTHPDGVPPAKKDDIEAQFLSIQSMISSLLKRS